MMIRVTAVSLLLALLSSLPVMADAGKPETTEAGLELVRISGGMFEFGASGARPVRVHVDDFYMSKVPVTQAAFQKIMGMNPSHWQADDNPVERITWAGAVKFCNRLSRLEGLQPVYNEETWAINYDANGYRLPTEAEWEYAARAGTSGVYFWGDDPGRLRFFAWVESNSGGRTRPVGRKLPNAFGLHDMYGNVWEWCNDFFQEKFFPADGEKNPSGPPQGELKVVRGGAWNSCPKEANSVFRGSADPGYVDICTADYDVYGFRIVRGAE